MTKTQSIIAIPAIALTLLAGGAIAGYATLASAQSATSTTGSTMEGRMGNRGPHVHGTVSAVSGTTITITDRRSGSTYTIDASAATFKKAAAGSEPTAVTISEIAVGDEISALGTISGTHVVATEVMEGQFRGHMGKGPGRRNGVMGTVASVNGNVITLTDRDGTTYTVNAGNASVEKMVPGALSDVRVGDIIGVDGTKDGTTVTATRIMDDMKQPTNAPAVTQ